MSVYECVYVCVCVCVYMYVHVVNPRSCVCEYMHVYYVHACMWVCEGVCACVCTCLVYMYVPVCRYVCTNIIISSHYVIILIPIRIPFHCLSLSLSLPYSRTCFEKKVHINPSLLDKGLWNLHRQLGHERRHAHQCRWIAPLDAQLCARKALRDHVLRAPRCGVHHTGQVSHRHARVSVARVPHDWRD